MPGELPVSAARLLVIAGLVLVGLGGLLWLLGFLPEGLRPGHLPGDLRWERDGVTIYVPLTTMLLLSLLGSAVLWFLRH